MVFTVHTSSGSLADVCTTDGKFPPKDHFLVGKDIEFHMTCKSFTETDDCADSKCVYNMGGREDETVHWSLTDYDHKNVRDLPDDVTDKYGVARTTVTVPDTSTYWQNVLYVTAQSTPLLGVDPWYMYPIVGENTDAVTMQMYRFNKAGSLIPISDGDTVYAEDQAVTVKINNPLSYYLALMLVENPDQAGKHMLVPMDTIPFREGCDPNHILVFPGEMEYDFLLAENAISGEFTFDLQYPEQETLISQSGKIVNDYLYFSCTKPPYPCSGNLEWRKSDGTVEHSWPAISGSNATPPHIEPLPSRTYHIFEFREKTIADRSYCDDNNVCWAANLRPWPLNGMHYQIHPDGGVYGTAGCIGLTQSDTFDIIDNLFGFYVRYGQMKVVVE